MASPYQPTPCRRCGGHKGPKVPHSLTRYCLTCAPIVQRERWAKWFPWWCGGCDNPHYCADCATSKRTRMKTAMVGRKRNSESNYFRPENAERYWQGRAHAAVKTAVKRGLLPSLKAGEYACTDCGGVAHEYDHRDYARALDVQPVCRSCNKQRGTAIWPTPERYNFPRFGPAPTTQAEVANAA